jgi:hypothetical protein
MAGLVPATHEHRMESENAQGWCAPERRLNVNLSLASDLQAQGVAMSFSHNIDWSLLDAGAPEPVQVGDLVSADAGGMPIFRVMACEPGRAWVAASENSPVRAVPIAAFRWRGTEP